MKFVCLFLARMIYECKKRDVLKIILAICEPFIQLALTQHHLENLKRGFGSSSSLLKAIWRISKLLLDAHRNIIGGTKADFGAAASQYI